MNINSEKKLVLDKFNDWKKDSDIRGSIDTTPSFSNSKETLLGEIYRWEEIGLTKSDIVKLISDLKKSIGTLEYHAIVTEYQEDTVSIKLKVKNKYIEDFELENLFEDVCLNELYFRDMTDEETRVVEEISDDVMKALRSGKKDVYVKDNVITIKGTNLLNRFSSVKMSDVVEGMILRRYYDQKPRVNITVTYFKVGGKATMDFYDGDKSGRNVNYSVGAGLNFTTSIKIEVKKSSKFKVGRIIKYMNNRDSSIAYEKLSEETIYQ